MLELEKENQNEINIPTGILIDAENLGKEIICYELPVVQKYLQNAQTNLEKNGLHPIKLAVIKWLLKEIPKAQTALNCPVQTNTNPNGN
jgi:hypothetical protein